MVVLLEDKFIVSPFLLFAFDLLVDLVDVNHFIDDLFVFPSFRRIRLVAAFGLVTGELNYFVPHTLAVRLDVGDQLGLFGGLTLDRGKLLSGCKDLRKSGRFNLFHLFSAVLGAHELAHAPEAAADGGIEIVFDTVIGAE